MDVRGREGAEDKPVEVLPDDIAALFSWAKMRGAQYLDFSASRREYRALVRSQAAQARMQRELTAQALAEAAATTADAAALAAEAEAHNAPAAETQAQRLQRLRGAGAAIRLAAAERAEAVRRGQAAAQASAAVERERAAVTAAHASASRLTMAGEHDSGSAAGRSAKNRWIGGAETAAGGVREMAERRYEEEKGPAWLYAPPGTSASAPKRVALEPTPVATLQDSKERVASRWFALKSVFEQAGPELPAMQPVRPGELRAPVLLVFSLAGGVGKTSLVATLGRALTSLGERVVLADTTAQRLLPFYFGGRELEAGVVRQFALPLGSKDAAISIVACDVEGRFEDARRQEMLAEGILRQGQGQQRMVVDLSAGSGWLIRRLANLHPTIVVPVAPDMNSVISLQALERIFEGMADAAGRPVLPYYVLNQFDATLALHLDVREVFRRQLGDRLLPLLIRRSPAVSEALAEGMTVMDYLPGAAVAKEYAKLAAWLRGVSPPALAGFRTGLGSQPGWSGPPRSRG